MADRQQFRTSIMRKRMLTGLTSLLLLGIASPLPLWAQNNIQYVYDALGRLTQVIDPSGNVATYTYDPVGNLLSITRSTASPSSLAIFSFSPAQGSVGQTVTIQGQNFSTTPTSNTVKFNGTPATVTAATTNQLTTTVPSGATTGPISVTVGSSTATSSSNFTVLAVPVITSITPAQVLNVPTINSFSVNGSNLTSATFSFLPAFSPAAITVSNVNINGNGTSATMTLSLASSASGSFTVVATNGSGSSATVSSTSNTLTVLSSDPNSDFDGDGLTNIYEAAIATNYAASSTTGDGLPDGWALFYTSAPPLNAGLASQTAPNGKTYLYSFQNGLNPLLNTVAPSVATVFPANGVTNYPTNGVIVVRFTEPLMAGVSLTATQNAINAALPAGSNFSTTNALAAAQVLQSYLQRTCCGSAAVPGTVQVLQNGQPVPGSVFLSNDALSLTFVPNKFLSASTNFTVSVQNVRDAGGNVMTQPFTSTFTTGLSPINTTPGALFTNPPAAATGVEINAPVRIEFSRPVNPATLTQQSFSVTDTFTNLAVPGTIQVDPSLFTASFVPAQPYGVGRQFAVHLTSAITDVTGVPISPISFVFTTVFVSDNQSPNRVGTSPADLATNVPVNALVVLEFNEPMDSVSALSGLQVQLAGVPIPGAIALSDGNKRITFTPSSPLAANSTYLVVTTSQLRDFAGNALSNPDTSTFTTGNTNDTTTPTVASVTPLNSATGVPTNTLIQVQFSKRIDPLTVTSATLSVFSAFFPSVSVPGTITVSTDGLTATLSLSGPLAPATTYTVQVGSPFGFGGAIIADLAGNQLGSVFNSSFTTGASAVTAAPTVLSVSPPDRTTVVPVNPRIDVVSSAPISAASPWSTAVTLLAGGVSVSGNATLSTDRTTLTFVPTNLLSTSTTYTINVSGFTDQAGNLVTPFTSTFTTGTSGTANTTQPSVTQVSPAPGASGVPVTSSIVLTFNEAIDPTSVNTSTVPIQLNTNSGGPVLAGSYAVNGTIVTFTPLTQLPGSTTVFVGVPGSVQDLSGNKNISFTSSFTTTTVADTTPPQVVSVTPNNLATGIGLNGTVVLTFSKSLNPNTINSNTVGLLADSAPSGSAFGTTLGGFLPTLSQDNTTVSLSPGQFSASTVVTVVATSGIQDLSGNALANFKSQFTTAPAFDTIHPQVTSQRPGNGVTGVPLNTGAMLYVNEPMNASTIPGALHISQNGVLVSGTTQVTNNSQVIQFTPLAPWQNGALIQVFLDSTALDADGSSLTNYQGSFTTVQNTSTIPPAVVSTNPVQNSSNIPTNVVIDIGFNETLNPATVSTSTVSLLQGTTTIASAVSLGGSGTTIQIIPNATLATLTSYSVSITNGVQGTNGLALPSTGTYLSFTTGTGTDVTNPNVVIVSPPNGAVNVGDNASVRVHFSKRINPLTVTATTMAISSGTGGTPVPYSASFSINGQDVSVVPFSPLPDTTQITIAISGVTDVAGNLVQPTSTTQFNTGSGPDLTTPVVVNVNPPNGATIVPLNTVIQLQINKPVDPGRVNNTTLVITDNVTHQTVAGTYSVSPDGLTISFMPSALLTGSRGYTISYSGGITDLVGNVLSGTNFSFTTGTASSTSAPQIVGVSPANGVTGVPINAQVVVQFNEPIDALTVNQVTLSSGSGPINVIRTLANANQNLVLVPLVPLNTSTTYTITITGVQDMSGNSLAAPVTQTFTTGIGADLIRPSVLNFNPANNATGVLRNSTIQLQFNKPIDPLTVTNSTFTLTASGQQVAGTISVSANGLTATLTPSTTLAASTQYQVSATNGITDVEGQPITFSGSVFTTGTQ